MVQKYSIFYKSSCEKLKKNLDNYQFLCCRLRSVDQWEIVKSALKRITIIEIFQPSKLEVCIVQIDVNYIPGGEMRLGKFPPFHSLSFFPPAQIVIHIP